MIALLLRLIPLEVMNEARERVRVAQARRLPVVLLWLALAVLGAWALTSQFRVSEDWEG